MLHDTQHWSVIRPGRIALQCSRLLKLFSSKNNGRIIGARRYEASLLHTSPSLPMPGTWCPSLAEFERSSGGGLVQASPEVFASFTSHEQSKRKSCFCSYMHHLLRLGVSIPEAHLAVVAGDDILLPDDAPVKIAPQIDERLLAGATCFGRGLHPIPKRSPPKPRPSGRGRLPPP